MKNQIRKRMLELRRSLDCNEVSEYSQKIITLIKDLDLYQRASCVAIYYPFNNEIDLRALDKKLVYPRINKKEMHFFDDSSGFVQNRLGIYEPVSNQEITKDKIDLIIVPLLAYNDKLYRVGYGGGYYDRYLADYKGIKIGVAFPFQLISDDFNDEYDIKLDMVVSL